LAGKNPDAVSLCEAPFGLGEVNGAGAATTRSGASAEGVERSVGAADRLHPAIAAATNQAGMAKAIRLHNRARSYFMDHERP
jgi:hypothetical protein